MAGASTWTILTDTQQPEQEECSNSVVFKCLRHTGWKRQIDENIDSIIIIISIIILKILIIGEHFLGLYSNTLQLVPAIPYKYSDMQTFGK